MLSLCVCLLLYGNSVNRYILLNMQSHIYDSPSPYMSQFSGVFSLLSSLTGDIKENSRAIYFDNYGDFDVCEGAVVPDVTVAFAPFVLIIWHF